MNGEEEQNALSTDAAAENADAQATDGENEEQTAGATDKKDDGTRGEDADVKTTEELMAEQQATAEAQDKAAGTTEAAAAQRQTPLHIVV